MQRSIDDLRRCLDGPLPFACTPFGPSGELDLARLGQHVEELLAVGDPGSVFVACGTGELWSLDLGEYAYVLGTAVDVVQDRVAVVAGLPYGGRAGREYLAAAEAQGVDAFLVFPPYLASGPQEGLYRHYAGLADATELPMIVYNRDSAVFEPQTLARLVAEFPNIVGIKDGTGDLDNLERMRKLVGERLMLLNGMPTAELYAPAYTKSGIRSYSPSTIAFAPDAFWAYDKAVVASDGAEIERLLAGFVRLYHALRSEVAGYGVALIKCGLDIIGRSVGGVRPPLVDPAPAHRQRLEALIEVASQLGCE